MRSTARASSRVPPATSRSRYAPVSVARPKRSSSVRCRRSSRLWRSSSSLRPEPRSPDCSMRCCSSIGLVLLPLLQRFGRLVDELEQLVHDRGHGRTGAVDPLRDVVPRLPPRREAAVGDEQASAIEVASRRGGSEHARPMLRLLPLRASPRRARQAPDRTRCARSARRSSRARAEHHPRSPRRSSPRAVPRSSSAASARPPRS